MRKTIFYNYNGSLYIQPHVGGWKQTQPDGVPLYCLNVYVHATAKYAKAVVPLFPSRIYHDLIIYLTSSKQA